MERAVRGTDAYRRLDKHRRYLRETGQPRMVSGDEAKPAFAKVRDYHTRGMACKDMAAATGLSESVLSQMINGRRYASRSDVPVTQVHRSSFDKVMAMEFVPPVRSGARLPALGARRRLQALSTLGYSHRWLADELGYQKPLIWRVSSDHQAKYVYFKTHAAICELYSKLQYTDPRDVGLDPYQVTRAKNEAARKGYPGPGCWDEDTIDDPSAIAEWTGECGTYQGVYLHRKYGIPLCTPCRDMRNRRRQELGYPARGRQVKR